MAEMIEKIATREAYGNALAEFGDKYDFVVLDADLAAATKTGVFKKKFPDRFFDCGIAEGNMMTVAAGLAAAGKIPFASTFAMFAAGRAFEQIRNSIAYPHLNVKIGATHAGITVGEDGATHQCLEDIGTMRTIPGMAIVNPADATEARAAVEWAINYVGPVYLRFGRLAVPVLFDKNDYKFEFGKNIEKELMVFNIIESAYMTHDKLILNAKFVPFFGAHHGIKFIFTKVYSVVENNSAFFESAFPVKISSRFRSASDKSCRTAVKKHRHNKTVNIKHPSMNKTSVFYTRICHMPVRHADRYTLAARGKHYKTAEKH
mgnify:CR=1 FL=1